MAWQNIDHQQCPGTNGSPAAHARGGGLHPCVQQRMLSTTTLRHPQPAMPPPQGQPPPPSLTEQPIRSSRPTGSTAFTARKRDQRSAAPHSGRHLPHVGLDHSLNGHLHGHQHCQLGAPTWQGSSTTPPLQRQPPTGTARTAHPRSPYTPAPAATASRDCPTWSAPASVQSAPMREPPCSSCEP